MICLEQTCLLKQPELSSSIDMDEVSKELRYEVEVSGLVGDDEMIGSPEVQTALVMLYSYN